MQIDFLTPKNMLFNVNNSTFSRREWKSGAGKLWSLSSESFFFVILIKIQATEANGFIAKIAFN
jgi:hypothetical protein